jgi:cytidylate kinase
LSLLRDKRVLIVGLGLIGGSVARGLRSRHACGAIYACDRDAESLRRAKADGVIDEWATQLSEIAPKADIIFIAVPTLSFRSVLRELKNNVSKDAIITDAASVKGSVVTDLLAEFPEGNPHFVPGHPIAGSEQSGYVASIGGLFEQRKVILTPLADTSPLALATIRELWAVLDSEVHDMSVDSHDSVLAATSHLPHLLAYALVNTLSGQQQVDDIFRYAAGGFAGFTRIASSDPAMWRDIFLANGRATVEVLDTYLQELSRMRQAILAGDGAFMQSRFESAREARQHFARLHFAESSDNADGGAVLSYENDAIPVLTIDGPGGAGKGTISTQIARTLGWHYLDSGALYRLLGIAATRDGVSLQDEQGLLDLALSMDVRFEADGGKVWLDGREVTDALRQETAGAVASRLAVIPSVRAALLGRQQQLRQPPGLVADGRDMGTVVFPDAQVKVFLTASAEERAKRRYKQLIDKGIDVNLSALFLDIKARDERDSLRSISPLKPAEDAVLVDTTELSIDQVVAKVLNLVRGRLAVSEK